MSSTEKENCGQNCCHSRLCKIIVIVSVLTIIFFAIWFCWEGFDFSRQNAQMDDLRNKIDESTGSVLNKPSDQLKTMGVEKLTSFVLKKMAVQTVDIMYNKDLVSRGLFRGQLTSFKNAPYVHTRANNFYDNLSGLYLGKLLPDTITSTISPSVKKLVLSQPFSSTSPINSKRHTVCYVWRLVTWSPLVAWARLWAAVSGPAVK